MRNILIALTITLITSNAPSTPVVSAQETPPLSPDQPEKPEARKQTVLLDNGAGTVTISGFVNTRYLRAPSTSLIVFMEGFNAKRGLFISNASPEDLYDGLINIGAVPAITTPAENDPENPPPLNETHNDKHVEPKGGTGTGTRLEIFIKWKEAHREYSLEEIVSQYPRQDYDIRFKGNMENSKSIGSGDLLSLDDTETGIAGNPAIPKFKKNSQSVSFIVNKRLLPPNGHNVEIVFRIVRDKSQ